MSKLVKDENIKNSVEENMKEKIVGLPKEETKKYFVLTDEEGNIKGYFPVKDKNLGKDWVALYQKAISTIADMNIPHEQERVFLKLLSKVDFDNFLRISQTEIANELKMKQPSVARAIKELCKKNIIIEGPRAGLNKTYRLNPYIAHKGKNRNETIIDFEDAMTEQGKNALRASDVITP